MSWGVLEPTFDIRLNIGTADLGELCSLGCILTDQIQDIGHKECTFWSIWWSRNRYLLLGAWMDRKC